MNDKMNKVKNALASFKIKGPFSSFFFSFVVLCSVYYFITKMFDQLEYTNSVKFIRECLSNWYYLMIIIIIFSTVIQLFE